MKDRMGGERQGYSVIRLLQHEKKLLAIRLVTLQYNTGYLTLLAILYIAHKDTFSGCFDLISSFVV